MVQNTRSSRPDKPAKPRPDFPLFPHATGRWAKKIRGKLHYFGPWADPQAALDRYLEQKEDLHAGRVPKPQSDGLTVRELLNRFLTHKRNLLTSEELSTRTFGEYHSTCQRISDAIGLNRLVADLSSSDFERFRAALSERLGPVALGNTIQRIRSVFKYGYDEGLIDKPMRYGQSFKRPSRQVLRKLRAEKGRRMFEAADIRRMIDKASQPLKAMILLGINCGFGNTDCGRLPVKALDFDKGWVDFPRPKTGVHRRIPLWPETVKAIREALADRPQHRFEEDAGLVFLTRFGDNWAMVDTDSPVSKEMAKLLKQMKLHRPGLNFYALRHTFETIGGESRDQVAVDAIMGHVSEHMSAVYRERISDERLQAVTDVVRVWLFPASSEKNKVAPKAAEVTDKIDVWLPEKKRKRIK